MTEPHSGRSRVRTMYGIAAAVALLVTVIFATLGDGVDVREASGLRGVIVDDGHTLVWVLLTVAFAIATVRARWTRLAGAVAVAAGIVYAVFLVAVFLWR